MTTRLFKPSVPVLLAFVLASALSSVSSAALVNQTVVFDTPKLWLGYVDWVQPTSSNAVTLDQTPNWTVAITEFETEPGSGVLAISAHHLVSPHDPPTAIALFLGAGFLGTPGSAAAAKTDTKLHEDSVGHYDKLTATLISRSAGVSRLRIQLDHIGASDVPEPSTLGLFGLGFIGLAALRRRCPKT
jgi:hypothetical protein